MKVYGKVIEASKARRAEQFDRAIEDIKALSPEAVEYIEKIPTDTWVPLFYDGLRLANETNNAGESANAALLPFRELGPVGLCQGAYESAQGLVAKRKAEADSERGYVTQWMRKKV